VPTGRIPEGPGCHQPVIELSDVSFAYERRPIIEHLHFTVRERDFALLAGPNGAGKTTLLKLIVGLLEPDGGEVRLFGEPARRFRQRERIGYVPQKNAFNPLFPATVREVVLSGMYGRHKLFRRLTKADYQKVDDAMQALGIEDLAG
jgi:zinc transport system ATP-binding protein